MKPKVRSLRDQKDRKPLAIQTEKNKEETHHQY